jgi:signal transduction histidine kinase
LDGSTGTFSDEAKDYLVQTNNANEQLLQLVSDLLEIARSDANKIQIEVAPMDLQKSIHAIISEVKPLTVEKHITISYEHKKSSVMVLADAARVKEIIMNFVTNGIKYNRENGTLTIRHEIKKQEIITHVKDAGFGIPKDEQKKIFEKFYRTKSARTSGVQGTGLGLFITKELVERMGGKIWFKSEEGKGTTFSFSLPKGSGTMPS